MDQARRFGPPPSAAEIEAIARRTLEALPDRILLFRRPILDEWADGEETLERLVAHILIHEAGHHFGFSDADMHALEESVR